MTARAFSFLADVMIEDADAVADHLEQHGYSVKIDAQLESSPSVPTIYAKRNKTEKVVIALSKIDRDKLRNWCAYGKSTGRDFRVFLTIPNKLKLAENDSSFLRTEGIGLLRFNGTEVIEEVAAKDLAVAISLPTLKSLPKKVRKHLGSAYEQFSKTQWREGFQDACQSLENLAREYLLAEIRKGRVTHFIRPTGSVAAVLHKVEKMTSGQLAHAFSQIPNQNKTDGELAQILQKINKDRVGVVHRKNHTETEASLRKNAGMHMWGIISAIKLLV